MVTNISAAGETLIKHFEGCAKPHGPAQFAAYPDPASGGPPWTIGWGTTGRDIHPGLVWSQDECDRRFNTDMQQFAASIGPLLKGTTTQHQFDALVAFAYNVGVAALHGSTLLKDHNAGNHAGAAFEFKQWNHAGGKVLNGLTVRRAAESALYSTPDGKPAPRL